MPDDKDKDVEGDLTWTNPVDYGAGGAPDADLNKDDNRGGDLPINSEQESHPSQIDRYRVVRVFGKGSFGVVYLAFDDNLDRNIAIKVPHRWRVSKPDDLALFHSEAKTVAKLDHPGIVPVYDVGETDDGRCFVVTKFVNGQNLAQLISDCRPDELQSAQIVAAIAEALHYAHQQGLYHRDVKPANILLDNNLNAYLTDFGLALNEIDFGREPSFAGTPAYMSPEQARGEGHRVDGRSDVFSLGVVLYELLTGRRPFRAKTLDELLELIATSDPRPPRQRDDSISKELERICLKATAKRAMDRYTTAKDFADDLNMFLASGVLTTSNRQTESDRVDSIRNVSNESQQETDLRTESSTRASSSHGNINVVPKGLLAFDANDADFFLQLLPGPRDRDGMTDAIRFWRSHLERNDSEATFSVGALYGPSGCGKTSFVRAGLLPLLSEDVTCVYIKATGEKTEQRLLEALQKRLLGVTSVESLGELLAMIRRGDVTTNSGGKLVLIIDQFEQWLHAQEGQFSELPTALRQCDGGNVQCLLMIRDDFWMGLTRLMRFLEIRLVDGENCGSIDLFDVRHAKKVLTAYGRAYEALPAYPGKLSEPQRQFIQEAISQLAGHDQVISVRLSLFADMVRRKPWSPETLRNLGGAHGVGEKFLEEMFGPESGTPRYRIHENAARSVLSSLLPQGRADIKGHSQSGEVLRQACQCNSEDFEELLQILVTELRLITPTDQADSETASNGGSTHYQLTHDYLVPSLRGWLTRKQRETVTGRAELTLQDCSSLWQVSEDRRQLPRLGEWIRIRLFSASRLWKEPQRKMMRQATRYYQYRGLFAAVVVLAMSLTSYEIFGRVRASAFVDGALSADVGEIPELIDSVKKQGRWVSPLLTNATRGDPSSKSKRNAELLFLALDESQLEPAIASMLRSPLSDVPAYVRILRQHSAPARDHLWQTLDEQDPDQISWLNAAAALTELDPDNSRWFRHSEQLAERVMELRSEQHANFGPIAKHLWPHLFAILRDRHLNDAVDIDRAAEVLLVLDHSSHQLAELVAVSNPSLAVQFFDLLLGSPDAKGELAKVWQAQKERANTTGLETWQERRVQIALALLRLDDSTAVRSLISESATPGLRTHTLLSMVAMEVPAKMVLDQLLQEADDIYFRQSWLIALGQYSDRELRPVQPQLIQLVADDYRDHPDAGIHATAEWLLRQWQQQDLIARVDETTSQEWRESGKRRWFHNKAGQPMVVILAGEFNMGSPDTEPRHDKNEFAHRRRVNRDFAIAQTEVTWAQFEEFQNDWGDRHLSQLAQLEMESKRLPASRLSWYDAAAYCNWLSEKDEIPESEWCYEPSKGPFQAGMKVKEGYLSKKGYRLPSEAEWEYAARAGIESSHQCGNRVEHLNHFANYLGNLQDGSSWEVGTGIPNRFGLFDSLGNVMELCQNRLVPYPEAQGVHDDLEDMIGSAPLVIDSRNKRVIRGGSFATFTRELRFANRATNVALQRNSAIGFRPVRTLKTYTTVKEVSDKSAN